MIDTINPQINQMHLDSKEKILLTFQSHDLSNKRSFKSVGQRVSASNLKMAIKTTIRL